MDTCSCMVVYVIPCVYIYIYIYIHTHINTHTHTHTHTHAIMYVLNVAKESQRERNVSLEWSGVSTLTHDYIIISSIVVMISIRITSVNVIAIIHVCWITNILQVLRLLLNWMKLKKVNTHYAWQLRGRACGRRHGKINAWEWLTLPVVICLSQILSHACLSISFYTAKLRMAH